MRDALEALVETGARLEAGDPKVGANRGRYGFTEIPFRIVRD